jgi:hypothetical protein
MQRHDVRSLFVSLPLRLGKRHLGKYGIPCIDNGSYRILSPFLHFLAITSESRRSLVVNTSSFQLVTYPAPFEQNQW